MNYVMLVGRLTADPEVKEYGDDGLLSKFTVAIDTGYGDNKETDFIRCVCFGKRAEFVEKYVKKGTRMAIVGRIKTGSYENKDGNTVYTTDVIVSEIEFADGKKDSNDEKKKSSGNRNRRR